MTVRYVLSWDEFLEAHKEHLPKPQVASFVGTILCAIALGAYGGLLLYSLGSDNRMPGSLFCSLSLVLFLAAFWELIIRTKQRGEQFIQGLRSNYGRQYSGEQAFDFDDQKWTHETEDGKFESPWSRLTYAVEQQKVFGLWTKSHAAILPKRVLRMSTPAGPDLDDTHTLDALRVLTLCQDGGSVSCHLSFIDYLCTEIPTLWRRRTVLMVAAHAAGLLFFVLLADSMRRSALPTEALGWLVAGAFLLLTITAQFWYFLIQYLTLFWRYRDFWQSRFSEQGMYGKNADQGFFVAWSVYTKFRETRRAFLLYTDSTHYTIFPKSCLSSERQAVLRRLLAEKFAV